MKKKQGCVACVSVNTFGPFLIGKTLQEEPRAPALSQNPEVVETECFMFFVGQVC